MRMKQTTGLMAIVLLCMTVFSFGQQKVNLATALLEKQIKDLKYTLEVADRALEQLEKREKKVKERQER